MNSEPFVGIHHHCTHVALAGNFQPSLCPIGYSVNSDFGPETTSILLVLCTHLRGKGLKERAFMLVGAKPGVEVASSRLRASILQLDQDAVLIGSVKFARSLALHSASNPIVSKYFSTLPYLITR